MKNGEMLLSVIVPARNEEDCVGACLQSLVAQSEVAFELGREWELIVVDDDSADATRGIAQGVEGVTVMNAPVLDVGPRGGFTGKTNAVWAGAQTARGRWLLFTDADTVHEPEDLSRAIHEAEKYGVAMLSYSPRQVVGSFAERILMPLVFAELANVYPPKKVSDPAYKVAAANGQFLLVTRKDYFDLGGHRGVSAAVLEDVALAEKFKRAGRGIRFRYGGDAVSARMYRSFGAMVEGWTKNLALLFPQPLALACVRAVEFALIYGVPVMIFVLPVWMERQRLFLALVWALMSVRRFYVRVAKSKFGFVDCALSVLGLPLFLWLLVRSYVRVKVRKRVGWKGREYKV